MFGETPKQRDDIASGQMSYAPKKAAEGDYKVVSKQSMPKMGETGPSAIWQTQSRKSSPSGGGKTVNALIQQNMMLAQIIQRLVQGGGPAGMFGQGLPMGQQQAGFYPGEGLQGPIPRSQF